MNKFLTLISFICLLPSCKHDCACNIYQDCLDGHCYCGEWGEGPDCTPMRNKFIGTFIGDLSLNGGTSVRDTITLIADGKANYLFWYPFIPHLPIRGFGIHLETSRTGICFIDYQLSNLSNQYLDTNNFIDCGDAALSVDGKTLTLTYHPVIDSALIDFSDKYAFVGSKQ